MRLSYLLFLLFAISLSSCLTPGSQDDDFHLGLNVDEEFVTSVEEDCVLNYTGPGELLWSRNMNTNGEQSAPSLIHRSEDMLFVVQGNYGSRRLCGINVADGTQAFKTDKFNMHINSYRPSENSFFTDQYFWLFDKHIVNKYDSRTGVKVEDFAPSMKLKEIFFARSSFYGAEVVDCEDLNFINLYDFGNGSREEKLLVNLPLGPHVAGEFIYVGTDDRSVLYFMAGGLVDAESKLTLFAFDVSKKEVLWTKAIFQDIEFYTNSQVSFHGEIFFIHTDDEIVAYDLKNSGAISYRLPFANLKIYAKLVEEDGLMTLMNDSNSGIKFDKQSGKILSSVESDLLGVSLGMYFSHVGDYYVTQTSLRDLNLSEFSDFSKIKQLKGPRSHCIEWAYQNEDFTGPVFLSAEFIMYSSDQDFLYAIDLDL